jgi:hypothetical protein
MDACPACTSSLGRTGKPHCESPGCTWLTCTRCRCNIDPDTDTFYRGSTLWGNHEGYIHTNDPD